MSDLIDALSTKTDTLLAAVTGLEALATTLKTDLDALAAGGTLSTGDQATVASMSTKIDTALAGIAATVTADTPAAPAP